MSFSRIPHLKLPGFSRKWLCIALLIIQPQLGNAEQQVYTFDVCGAPNRYEPGWMPHGDPNVNGTMTLTIDSAKGLMTLDPSPELLVSTRYVSLHGHLYDLQHRYDNSDLGQSTICWAYYNTEEHGVCLKKVWSAGTFRGGGYTMRKILLQK